MSIVSFKSFAHYWANSGPWISKTWGSGGAFYFANTGAGCLIAIAVSNTSKTITSLTMTLPIANSNQYSEETCTIEAYLYESSKISDTNTLKPLKSGNDYNIIPDTYTYTTESSSYTFGKNYDTQNVTFTFNDLNITGSSFIYIKLKSKGSYIKTVNTAGSTPISSTETSSGGGGTTTTYYAYLKYNLQGGDWDYQSYDGYSSTSSTTFKKKVTSIVPTKENCTFKGWATTASSTVVAYDPGDDITLNGATGNGITTNIYAVWEENAGGDSSGWSWESEYGYTYTGTTNFEYELSAGKVAYTYFRAPAKGTLQVYTTGNYDTYGYLVNEGSLIPSANFGSGAVSASIVYQTNDDISSSDRNFSYTYEVTAGTTYEIDWCAYSKTAAIDGRLYIVFTAAPTITTWQAPVRIASIRGSSYTEYSATSAVNKYNAGYVRYTTPSYAGKIVFQTTSGVRSPNYYSYLSTSTLDARTDTETPERDKAVTGTILAQNDNGGAAGRDTLISYECNASTYYYWYVNAAWASSGTYNIPWKLNYYEKYTITYDANGGTGAPSSQPFYEDNTTVSIPSTTPTRPNHTFLGWSTSAYATSATYTAGSSPTLSTQNYTLYAVWKLSTYSITITYDANGGSGAPSAFADSGNIGSDINIQISSIEPTRDRHIFKGWADGNTTTVAYQSGQTYPFSSNKTLYAVWENKFGADNVYYGINGEWKLVETYYGVNGQWIPLKIYYGKDNEWKNNT